MKNREPKRLRDILEGPMASKPSEPEGSVDYTQLQKRSLTTNPHFKHTEDPIFKDIQKERNKTSQNDILGQEILDQKEKDFYKDPKKEMIKPLNKPAYDTEYQGKGFIDIDRTREQKDRSGRDI